MVVLSRLLLGFASTQRRRISLLSDESRASRHFFSIANSFWHQTLLLSSFSEHTHAHTTCRTHTHTHATKGLAQSAGQFRVAAPPLVTRVDFWMTSPRRADYEWEPGSDFWGVKALLPFRSWVKTFISTKKNLKLSFYIINVIFNNHVGGSWSHRGVFLVLIPLFQICLINNSIFKNLNKWIK